jgi:hypothetical protein
MLVVVGVASLAVAVFGAWYNFSTFGAVAADLQPDPKAPYYHQAFYIMSGFCVAFYLALAAIGIQLIRGKTNVWGWLLGVVILEVAYFVATSFLWLSPTLGVSVASATGVSSGGLMIQLITLFPVWAPLVAWLASRSLRNSSSVAADGTSPAPMASTKSGTRS